MIHEAPRFYPGGDRAVGLRLGDRVRLVPVDAEEHEWIPAKVEEGTCEHPNEARQIRRDIDSRSSRSSLCLIREPGREHSPIG